MNSKIQEMMMRSLHLMKRSSKYHMKVAKIAGVCGIVGLYVSSFCVDTGHRAVLVNRLNGDIKNQVYGEGIHMKIPWFREVKYNVRPQSHFTETIAYSRLLTKVKISVQVLIRPIPDQLPAIYRNYGEKNYHDHLFLDKKIDQVLNQVIGNRFQTNLHIYREEISKEILKQLKLKLAEYHIAVDDVHIKSLVTESLKH